MPENKPKFDPNKPYQPAGGKPAFDPNKSYTPVGDNLTARGRLEPSSASVLNTPQAKSQLEIGADKAVELIKNTGGRNGTKILDSELEVLRDVLKDPRATSEQRKNAMLTIQGYDPKHSDNNTMYYMSQDENGVYTPKALAYGEKPPKGFQVAKVWGNKADAENDRWYTDMGKSLANGVLGAAEGVINLAQAGQTLVTGEESKYLNQLSNTASALKFEKDSETQKPIFNTEGITQFSDLVDPKRFDLSPKALWGGLNMAAESLVSFAGGAKGASLVMKNSPKAALFTGSYMTQLGENLDNAEAAGLKGRDKATVASLITAPMAAIDAFFGLEGKVLSPLFQKSKRELLKDVIKTIPKDELGNITEEGFKQLAKKTALSYTDLAKTGVKEVVGDIVGEGGQEAVQTFVQKAGQELWDKLSDEDKAKFGTEAFSPESFGEYINSFATGLVGGAPMALVSSDIKKKAEEQSLNAYQSVKDGPEAVKSLKAELDNAFKNNEINQDEHDLANFKIDKYQQYHDLTQKYNMKPEDEKRAFEITFQIDGLNTEIPKDKKEMNNLSPIEKGEVMSKKKQRDDLQKELDDIILRSQVQSEPVVADNIEQKIASDNEKDKDIIDIMSKKYKAEEMPGGEVTKKERLKLEETEPEIFNQLNDLGKKQTVQEYLKDKPNKAMEGKIFIEQNGKHAIDLGGGKFITLASSVADLDKSKGETRPSPIKRENLPEMETGVFFMDNGKIVQGKSMNDLGEQNMPVPSSKDNVIVKREEIDSFDNEGNPVLDADGNQKKKAILNVYNKQTGAYIVSVKEHRTGKSKYSPKEISQMQAIQKAGFTPITGEQADLITASENPVEMLPPIEKPKKQPKQKVEKKVAAKEELTVENLKEFQEKISKVKPSKESGDYEIKVEGNVISAKTKDGLRTKVAKHFHAKERVKEMRAEKLSYESAKSEVGDVQKEILKDNGYSDSDIKEAIESADEFLSLSRIDLLNKLVDLGFFNYLDRADSLIGRPDLRGLDKSQVKGAIEDINSGITDSVRAKVMLDFIDRIKKNGAFPMMQGTGGTTLKNDIPVFEFMLQNPQQRELTEDEIRELEILDEYRKAAESKGYFQKKKINKETISKFEKSADMYYKVQESEGGAKKRNAASKRREFLESNPEIKYIDDNIAEIYKQLEAKNLLTKKGNCP